MAKSDCSLCKRKDLETTRHHLIPRSQHKRAWCKKKFIKKERDFTVPLCMDCHYNIHKLVTEKDMARDYYTIELLLTNPKVKKYVDWISKR